MTFRKYFVLLFLTFFIGNQLRAQSTKRVLLIGNSYTYYHNMPGIIESMLSGTGDTLYHELSTPGGYRYLNHATNAQTLEKIRKGNWDYVVLQAQSQETSFDSTSKANDLYPYAQALVDSIRKYNRCVTPVFYMTWGRKNGDNLNCQFLPWVCTYEGMDDSIRSTYTYMAKVHQSMLSPAGAVWRDIRTHNPQIELYSPDESHPSLAGSYAVASAMYAMIFDRDPKGITWNYSLGAAVADTIKAAASRVAFDRREEINFTEKPMLSFTDSADGLAVRFFNTGAAGDSVSWFFGDGVYSRAIHPSHTYQQSNSYTVQLSVYKCGKEYKLSKLIQVQSGLGIEDWQKRAFTCFPNPVRTQLAIELNKEFTELEFSLMNAQGREIQHHRIIPKGRLVKVDLTDLKPGTYFIRLASDKEVLGAKTIVKIQ